MSKRKARPQPPRYVWFETDGCWFCKNRKGCSGCKVMKRYVAIEKAKKKYQRKEED